MQLTQRQITTGVFGLVTASAFCLSVLFALSNDITGLSAASAGLAMAAALWAAYWKGWDQARHGVVLVSAVLIPFAFSAGSIATSFHPMVFFPAVLAVVLTTPRWIVGSALGTYLLLLLRAGWVGRYAEPEFALSYLIIVGGLVASRLATDTAQRLADASARAEAEQLRAEAALAEAALQTAALSEALGAVAERETALTATLAELRASEAAVQELSAPILPILPGVLVAPLIGAMDSDRAALFARNLLGAIERQGARRVIFDITGVPVVDTNVAATLLQAAAAAGLLGARVALVGIRPEVAQTLVALGVGFEAMTPYADLQEAVRAFGGPATTAAR
jgi:rsbT co-antagonist protein RsbR